MKTISTNDLIQMLQNGDEALILQGCGGPLNEWVDGINEMLTEEGILLEGTRFSNVSVFNANGLTNLAFPMDEDVKLDVGKLAMWRLQTHNNFGGTWLSDYAVNQLGFDDVASSTSIPEPTNEVSIDDDQSDGGMELQM